MAPSTDPFVSLRHITTALTSTPESELPPAIPALARILYGSPVLDSAIALHASPSRTRAEEAALLTNKFKTRISALLQSKNAAARWCGVVMVKASVETSFSAMAEWAAGWARMMIGLLTVPELSTTQ